MTTTTSHRSLKTSSFSANNLVEKKGCVKPVAPRAAAFYKAAQRNPSTKPGTESLQDLLTRLDEQEKRLSHLEDTRKSALDKSILSQDQLRKEEQNKTKLTEYLNKLFEKKRAIEANIEATRTRIESIKDEERILVQTIRETTVEVQCLKATLDSQQCKTSLFERESLEQKQRMEDTRGSIESLLLSLEQERQTRHQSENARNRKMNIIERLQADLKQLQRELEEQSDSIERNKNENEKLCQQIKDYAHKLREGEQQLEAAQAKIQMSNNQLEASRQKTACIEEELRNLKMEKDALSKQYEELKEEESCMKAKLNELLRNIESLSEEMHRLKSQEEKSINEYKKEASRLYECLQNGMREREQLDSNINSFQEVSNETKQQWEELQKQVEELQLLISQKEKQVEDEVNQKNNLLQQIEQAKESISLQQVEIAELDEQCRQDEITRRYLHNLVQELKGNIRVFCRIRPNLAKEIESMLADNITSEVNRLSISSASSVSSVTSSNMTTEPQFRIVSSSSVEVVAPSQRSFMETNKNSKQHLSKWSFSFDRIFGPESTQEEVFEEISQLVQSALDGYRVCIFAYGQTGSGKTYTMLGGENEGESGVIPKSMRKIFSAAESRHEHNWEFHLKASFLEIYNETIRDLLADQTTSIKERNYDIKIDRLTGATYVVGLTVEDISTPQQLEKLLRKSMANRATAATRCNERSSRSHSVFRLYISGRNKETGQERVGLLNLIDLAGSERLNSSGSTGDRLRETQHINKSLSALGDVISSLSNKEKYIPYRNSKLTYLLQDSLGGDSKTLMFVNISPTADSFQETLCSLRFAQKVNSCQIGTARRVAKVDLCAGYLNDETATSRFYS
jgi:kinesin family protein C1